MKQKAPLSSLKDQHPKEYKLAKRKLELNRQIQEMKLKLSQVNEELLDIGSLQARDIVACW